MTTTFSGQAAALLEQRIEAVTAEIKALDHSLQLAHAHGDYRGIAAVKDAWQLTFQELSRLIQQRRKNAK